jgi:hypothetical protein
MSRSSSRRCSTSSALAASSRPQAGAGHSARGVGL